MPSPVDIRKAESCGAVRPSRRGRVRALVLILVHVAIVAHIAHWRLAGRTLAPLEPSEAQFTPKLGFVNAGLILLLLALLATVIFGRFFCGWACHVVAYQDLCAWLLRKIGIRPKPVRSRLLMLVPAYAAFDIFAWPWIARWLAPEPGPALTLHLATTDLWATFPGPVIAALTLLVDGFLIVWLLGAKGFCTYGCPYGALFGITDRAAPGRIRVNDACEQCGHCTAVCTSNVRVHEEVRTFGMVTDPRCMKCLDCVSVCPKDALRFGFGPAPLLLPGRGARPRRHFDLSFREEIAAGIAFILALVAFRGLYGAVPFLLALGLAVLSALACVSLVRLLRRRDVAFQGHPLRRAGRLTARGGLALAGIALWVGVTAQSLAVSVTSWRGRALLEESLRLREGSAAQHGLAEQSVAWLRSADALGLFEDPRVTRARRLAGYPLALRHILDGRDAAAEACLRSVLEAEPDLAAARHFLAGILNRRGDFAGAHAELREILRLEPGNERARRNLEEVAARLGMPPAGAR